MTDESGTPLVRASAVWLLMDAKNAKWFSPKTTTLSFPE